MDPEDEFYWPYDDEDGEECDCGDDTCVCQAPGPSFELREVLSDALKTSKQT